jgi:hypothetical protein
MKVKELSPANHLVRPALTAVAYVCHGQSVNRWFWGETSGAFDLQSPNVSI